MAYLGLRTTGWASLCTVRSSPRPRWGLVSSGGTENHEINQMPPEIGRRRLPRMQETCWRDRSSSWCRGCCSPQEPHHLLNPSIWQLWAKSLNLPVCEKKLAPNLSISDAVAVIFDYGHGVSMQYIFYDFPWNCIYILKITIDFPTIYTASVTPSFVEH